MKNSHLLIVLTLFLGNAFVISCSPVKSIKNASDEMGVSGDYSAKIKVSSNPSGANYVVAHRYSHRYSDETKYEIVKEGQTPDDLKVNFKTDAGKPKNHEHVYEVIIQKDGHLEQSRELLLEPGETENVDVSLAEKPKIPTPNYKTDESSIVKIVFGDESKFSIAYENEILSYADVSAYGEAFTSLFFPYKKGYQDTINLSIDFQDPSEREVGSVKLNGESLGFYLTRNFVWRNDLRSPKAVYSLPLERILYVRFPNDRIDNKNTDQLSEKELRVIPGEYGNGQRVRQIVNSMKRKLIQVYEVNRYIPYVDNLEALRVFEPTSKNGDIEVLKALKNQEDLRNVVFKFTDSEKMSSEFLEDVVSNLTQITHLTLQSKDLTDRKLKNVKGLNNLRYLDISDNEQVTSIGLQFLTELKNLHTLDVSKNDNIDNEGVKYVSKLGNLEKLDVRSIGDISYTGLKHLSSLNKLKVLDIGGSNDLKKNDLSFLNSLGSLKILKLDASISSNVLKDVGQVDQLTYLDISGTRIDSSGFHHLKSLNNLEQLKMYGAVDIQFEDLNNLVSSLDSLKKLYINEKALSKKNLSRLRVNYDQIEVVTP